MPRSIDATIGIQIVAKLESTLLTYVALDAGLGLVLALWMLGTHLFDCFDAFPYLAITSPTKRCGKTRLAEVMEFLCAKPLRTVGITPAALFRSIEQDKPTLIIDEAESLRNNSDRSNDLREILNAGYRRGQKVRRCESPSGRSFTLRDFETYCPKVLVLIGNLPPTLADRCIPIRMRRAGAQEKPARFRYGRARRLVRPFLKKITQWAVENRERVKRHYIRHDLEFLTDRETELWLPLFSVCAVACPERLKELGTVARLLSRDKQSADTDESGVTLLKDIRDVLVDKDRVPTWELLVNLKAIEESPWGNWSRGMGLDARALARLLRPFEIQSKNLRLEDDQIVKGYAREDFREAWASYLGEEAPTTNDEARGTR